MFWFKAKSTIFSTLIILTWSTPQIRAYSEMCMNIASSAWENWHHFNLVNSVIYSIAKGRDAACITTKTCLPPLLCSTSCPATVWSTQLSCNTDETFSVRSLTAVDPQQQQQQPTLTPSCGIFLNKQRRLKQETQGTQTEMTRRRFTKRWAGPESDTELNGKGLTPECCFCCCRALTAQACLPSHPEERKYVTS